MMNVLRRFHPWRTFTFVLLLGALPMTGANSAELTINQDDTVMSEALSEAMIEAMSVSDGPIALGDALALALARNPRLAIFNLEMRVAEAGIVQAALRPNPDLSLEVENFVGSGEFSGFDSSEITLSVAQLFELNGRRPKREEVARLGSDLAIWDYESVRLEVYREVTRAFVAVVAAQAQVSLADDIIDVTRQDMAAVKRRVTAGATSPIELTRARIAVATAEMDRETAALRLAAARAELASTWGSDQAIFGIALGDLENVPPPPGIEKLVQRLESNPDLARWQTEQSQRVASLELARAIGTIDLTAAAGIRRLEGSGDNALVAGVAIPLRFRNPNQGGIQAAEVRLRQVEKEQLSVLVSANAELVTIHAELTAAYLVSEALVNSILPDAEEAMTTAESAYLKGLFSFTDVLAVRTTNFELRGRYIESLARYHSAAADIERLVAGPLSGNEQEQEQP